MCRERGSGLHFVETRGHVGGRFGFCADGVEVGGDVRVAGVEGDVFVAGALVDGEGDEGRGHLVWCVRGLLEEFFVWGVIEAGYTYLLRFLCCGDFFVVLILVEWFGWLMVEECLE